MVSQKYVFSTCIERIIFPVYSGCRSIAIFILRQTSPIPTYESMLINTLILYLIFLTAANAEAGSLLPYSAKGLICVLINLIIVFLLVWVKHIKKRTAMVSTGDPTTRCKLVTLNHYLIILAPVRKPVPERMGCFPIIIPYNFLIKLIIKN